MKKITADKLFTADCSLSEGKVLIIDDNSTILAVELIADHDPTTLEYHKGILSPGFINAHCHLELSHMKGRIDTGTGLLSFIGQVVTLRSAEEEVIQHAIEEADREMWQNGIVATGDISNVQDSFRVKETSSIAYYTFVEVFDFLNDSLAADSMAKILPIFEKAPKTNRNKASVVPHAPYSVSPSLFQKIMQKNPKDVVMSIHNQETDDENNLFLKKEGGIPPLFSQFGFTMEDFAPTGYNSVHYPLQYLNPEMHNLFIHNTKTEAEDIQLLHSWSDKVFWVTCPNANLYIENTLPDYKIFLAYNAKICLGTDSLTSNWSLSILDEMKTIRRYNSWITTEQLLQWATINGAMALKMDNWCGSFEEGKTPGVNLITTNEAGEIYDESQVVVIGN